jgi:Cu/Ag efflux protein CusF
MKSKFIRVLAAAAVAATLGVSAHATQHADAASPQSDGEVRKIDKEQGKVTLRHGPLRNLDMPATTMVFKTADPRLLEGLKEGDKVRFTAEKVNGAFTVTAIRPAGRD